jgi:WD40 repeat protein
MSPWRSSPDGKRLAGASGDGTVRVWEVDKEHEPLDLEAHPDLASALAFSPDSRRLATASHDRRVQLRDIEWCVETFMLKAHTRPVSALSFSRDGTRLASASFDGTVRVWHAPKSPTAPEPK